MDLCKTTLLISILLTFPEAGVLAQPDQGESDTSSEKIDPGGLDQQTARFDTLLRDGTLDEAENVAKQRVETTIRESGPRSIDTAFALTGLGTVQVRTDQYDAAEQNFQSAIEIIGEVENRLHELVIDPLRGLGQTYLESGRPDLAARTFSAAIHIMRVNSGPHNIGQIELLESLAESQLRAGKDQAARDTQDQIHAITARYYRDDRLAMVTPLMRRGDWLFQTKSFHEARDTYRQVVRIIESERGKKDLSLIEPLIKLGSTYLYVDTTGAQPLAGTPTATGESYYKRAVRIAESAPATDWARLAKTRVALGDFNTISGDYNSARSSYLEAWDMVSEDPSRYELRAKLFGDAFPLTKMWIPSQSVRSSDVRGLGDDDELLQGSVTATYIINDRGRITKLRIDDLDPPEFTEMADHVTRKLRNRRFRPRLDETGPVGTPPRVFTHRFQYRQAELDALRAREAAEN